jgi:hypothetical protein
MESKRGRYIFFGEFLFEEHHYHELIASQIDAFDVMTRILAFTVSIENVTDIPTFLGFFRFFFRETVEYNLLDPPLIFYFAN